MRDKKLINIIVICAVIAIITSSYLLYLHYSSTSSFCDISREFSCDIVNKSQYSEIFDVPVSLLSLLAFIFILITAFYIRNNKEFFGFNKDELVNVLIILMALSIIFALYLVYIELFILYSICVLCFLLDILIIIILICGITLKAELKLMKYINKLN